MRAKRNGFAVQVSRRSDRRETVTIKLVGWDPDLLDRFVKALRAVSRDGAFDDLDIGTIAGLIVFKRTEAEDAEKQRKR